MKTAYINIFNVINDLFYNDMNICIYIQEGEKSISILPFMSVAFPCCEALLNCTEMSWE